jgi:hypothetical protein
LTGNDSNVPTERPSDSGLGSVLRRGKRWVSRGGGGAKYPLVRFVLASAIIILWIAIYYKAFTDPTFHVPEGLSGVAIAAATYLFGSGLLSKKGDDD